MSIQIIQKQKEIKVKKKEEGKKQLKMNIFFFL